MSGGLLQLGVGVGVLVREWWVAPTRGGGGSIGEGVVGCSN